MTEQSNQTSQPKVLAVITARGGSVGLPGKNIKLLLGKPLITWSIDECKKSKIITDLIVSTDSQEIADVAVAWGGDVPFMRPSELAQSETSHVPVMQHAVLEMERKKRYQYDYVVIIQPTSPFREVKYIDELIDLMMQEGVQSGVTVHQVDDKYHPLKMKKMVGNRLSSYYDAEGESQAGSRRQDLSLVYKRSGDVYVTARNYLMTTNKIYSDDIVGYVVDSKKVVDIDTIDDWEVALKIARTINK